MSDKKTPVKPMKAKGNDLVAPTPQNTPATHLAPQLSQAQVPPTLEEEEEDDDDIPVISSGDNQDPSARVAQLVNLAGGGNILTNVIQSRFNHLIGASSGYVESLPQAVKSRLTGLKGIQAQQFEVESQLKKEILELKKKYAAKFDPLFERRKAIILGLSEATDAEFEKGLEEEAKDDDDDDEDDEDSESESSEEEKVKSRKATKEELEEGPKGVPEFWLTAMKNHVGLGELISERDELLLKHLTDIKVSYDLEEKDKLGFKLIFEFNKDIVNKEWFDNVNGILEKTYYYQDKVAYDGDFVYDKAVGTKIEWKEGKDLTVKVEKKRQRNKNTGQTRTIKKTVPTPSFFTFFSPPDPEQFDEEEDEEEDDLRNKLELDYQIGVDIQERLIPRAIDYFTGRALEFDETDFDDDDDFAFDDDEEDEDEDDEEDFGQRKIKKKAPKPPISGVTPTEPQECRNQ